MNSLNLFDLMEWHIEQRNELTREEGQENWLEFHNSAVKLLEDVINNFLPTPYQLTEKGKEVVDWNAQCECFQCCSEGHCGCSECKEPCTC